MISQIMWPLRRYEYDSRIDVIYKSNYSSSAQHLHDFIGKLENVGVIKKATFEVLKDFKIERMASPGDDGYYRYILKFPDGTREEMTSSSWSDEPKFLVYSRVSS